MSRKIFISYCHRQGDWVWQRLVPCLKAGGADVRIDVECFKAGFGVIGQMNVEQDGTDLSLLVLTPEYFERPDCLHEMRRAIARDPNFANGSTIPVIREACELPDDIKFPKPLWVNLTNDNDTANWDKLLKACEADLGADVPHWLEVRDELLRALRNSQSVNLVVNGSRDVRLKWKELLAHVAEELLLPQLGFVDLDRGLAATRPGLVEAIFSACDVKLSVPDAPRDLAVLDRAISERTLTRIALLHLDHVPNRLDYGIDLFSALRHLTESRKLVLLAQSRTPLSALLPHNHPLSSFIPNVVELHGRK